MFKTLLSLYQKEKIIGRTPLEDFITEIFAKILGLNKDFQKEFISFLSLPEDDYTVKTQKKYFPKDENDTICIVDIVLTGLSTGTLCFFESKVHSVEGQDQLDRYEKILKEESVVINKNRSNEEKKLLVYCTKNFDLKDRLEPHFTQLRWYQISEMLHSYSQDAYVEDFLNLLKSNGMSQRMVFSSDDFVVFRNIQDTLSLVIEYLERSKPDFKNIFDTSINPVGLKMREILAQNRAFYRYGNVLGPVGWADLKYGFELEVPSVFVNIWIDKKNPYYIKIQSAFSTEKFYLQDQGHGLEISLRMEISDLRDIKEAEFKIYQWFKNAFNIFAECIEKAKENGVVWTT